jgi:hypothetical protein
MSRVNKEVTTVDFLFCQTETWVFQTRHLFQQKGMETKEILNWMFALDFYHKWFSTLVIGLMFCFTFSA